MDETQRSELLSNRSMNRMNSMNRIEGTNYNFVSKLKISHKKNYPIFQISTFHSYNNREDIILCHKKHDVGRYLPTLSTYLH